MSALTKSDRPRRAHNNVDRKIGIVLGVTMVIILAALGGLGWLAVHLLTTEIAVGIIVAVIVCIGLFVLYERVKDDISWF